MAAMKQAGDGTGQGKQPPRRQGLMANENAKAATLRRGTGAGEGAVGAIMPKAGSGNRTTSLRGAR